MGKILIYSFIYLGSKKKRDVLKKKIKKANNSYQYHVCLNVLFGFLFFFTRPLKKMFPAGLSIFLQNKTDFST